MGAFSSKCCCNDSDDTSTNEDMNSLPRGNRIWNTEMQDYNYDANTGKGFLYHVQLASSVPGRFAFYDMI